MYVEALPEGSRTRVRFPPPPPYFGLNFERRGGATAMKTHKKALTLWRAFLSLKEERGKGGFQE